MKTQKKFDIKINAIANGNKPLKTMTNNTYPILSLFALACFAFSPNSLAVGPPPDGGLFSPGHG